MAPRPHTEHVVTFPSPSPARSSFDTLKISVTRTRDTVSTPLSPPPAAHYADYRHRDELITQFWGGPRRDRTSPSSPLPTYRVAEKLPSYAEVSAEESVSHVRWFWRWGFLFPPFWIVGVVILCSPLRVPDEWHSEKAPNDRAVLLQATRRVERVYSKRCLIALVIWVMVVVLLAIIVASIVER